MSKYKDIGRQIAKAVMERMQESIDKRDAEIAELRAQVEAIKAIKPPQPKELDRDIIRDIAVAAIADMPKPRDGKDGADGKDGMGFDDLSVDEVSEREFVISLKRGDKVITHNVHMPSLIYRGRYSPDKLYAKGDAVSRAGQLWIAIEQVLGDGPTEGSQSWDLAARAGRDGLAGKVHELPAKVKTK